MSSTEVEGFTNEALSAKIGEEVTEGEQPPQADTETGPLTVTGTESTEDDEETSDAQKILDDRFGGDPLKAVESWRQLENKLSEQGQELGQMRQIMEERLPPPDEYDDYVEPTDEAIYENPGQTAEKAYKAGDREGVRKALAAWKEEDSFSAGVWFSERRADERQAESDAKFEKRLQPTEQRTQSQVVQDAYGELSSKHTDFDQFFKSDAYGEVLNGLPAELRNATLEVMQGGDKRSIAGALEYVYKAGKGQGWSPAEGDSNTQSSGTPPGQAAVLGQELGVPGGSQQAPSGAETLHATLKGQILAEEGTPEEAAFVTAARQIRADRNLQY